MIATWVGQVRVSRRGLDVSPGQEITVSIRSEQLTLSAQAARDETHQSLPAVFHEQVYLGLTTNNLAHLENGTVVLARGISEGRPADYSEGTPLHLIWKNGDGLLHVE